MKQPLVSIVLPIYRVAPYLNRCLETIVAQTYHNLEIILVDDGSPDESPALCDEWEKKDDRIQVIHKENAGAGLARNSGIERATGDYIFFIDSDDFVDLQLVEICLDAAAKTGAEIVHYGYNHIDADGNIMKVHTYTREQTLFEGKDVLDVFFPEVIGPKAKSKDPKILFASPWAAMYSMDLIRRTGWRFVSEREIVSEDYYAHLFLYKYIQTAYVIKKALYNYCENPVSLSRSYQKNKFSRFKHFYSECIAACQRLELGQEVMERLAHPFFTNTITAMKQIAVADIPKKERLALMKEILHDDTFHSILVNWYPGGATWKMRFVLLPLMRMRLARLCCLVCALQAKQ